MIRAASSGGGLSTNDLFPKIQPVTPTTGQTIVMTDNSDYFNTLSLTPIGMLAALIITFPTSATSHPGRIRRIATTQNITSLTLNGATISGAMDTLNAGDNVGFQETATNSWMRMI